MKQAMGKEKIKVGLIGCGTIGGGVLTILKENGAAISEKINAEIVLAGVAERNQARLEDLGVPVELRTVDAESLLVDPDLDIIIELIGGIEPARGFIRKALEHGKYVVTANKDLMATHGGELLALAREKGLNIFYEASVGGGIPLIRPLKQGLIADRLNRVVGIVNGTTNYILTRMSQDGLGFEEALTLAQELGFAEADPTSDIEGRDAVYKLIIMAGLAFGQRVHPDHVFVEGIKRVTKDDIAYAGEIGYAVKLVAIGERLPEGVVLRVHPTLVPLDHPLASVRNEFNAVLIEGEALGDVMFYGRGAGSMPTATAVLADVAEAASLINEAKAPYVTESIITDCIPLPLDQLESRFYLRFLADDKPGVFAALANAFGDEQVSLDMVIQKRRVNSTAEIVLVTHMAREDAFKRAFDKVVALPAIKPGPSMFRLLG
jgi:homoserine dehydrogenase